jgi:Tir chaperone protein (CesT) family
MSLQNAEENLKEFGKELNLDGLTFDENNTCILGIDNTFSLHLTYEPNSDRLYLYSPILDGLPRDDKTKLTLYEALLVGSMLGGQMAGGGIGVAPVEELVLLHYPLYMGPGTEPQSLSQFAPLFVEVVEKWRDISTKIMQGIKVDINAERDAELKRMQQQQAKGSGNIRPDGQFMKI